MTLISKLKQILEQIYLTDSHIYRLVNQAYESLDPDQRDSYYNMFVDDFDGEELPDEDSGEFEDYIKEELKSKLESYLNNFEITGNKIKIYRGLALDDIKDLKNELGVYWSFHLDGATDEYVGGEGENLYVIVGETDIKYIDIDQTLLLGLAYSDEYHEDEVRLLPKSKVKLLSILKKDRNTEKYSEVNSSFIGQELTA